MEGCGAAFGGGDLVSGEVGGDSGLMDLDGRFHGWWFSLSGQKKRLPWRWNASGSPFGLNAKARLVAGLNIYPY
jgi:hypothetical protein